MYDVIVVGARCAGASTAMLLAKRGYRVLLLDRASFPSDMTMSTHLIHARGIAHLRRWGLFPEIEKTACRPMTAAIIDLGPFSLSASAPAVDGSNAGFGPRRILLDEILVRAAENAGAELRERSHVDDLLFDDDRVVGVRGQTSAVRSFSDRSRFVIGADGPGSTVARRVCAETYAEQPAHQGTAWSYWSGVDLADRLRLSLRDYEAVYAFPTSEGQTLVGVNWAGDDRYRTARQDLERSYFEALTRIAPAFADEVRSGRQEDRIWTGTTRNFFRKPVGPGWALVGDAGYKKDPCTAQGITDAFLDAEHLAEKLDDVLAGRATEAQALSEFHRARDAWAMPYYELTCEMARFAPPPAQTVALYRALAALPDDASRFLGLITEAVSPLEFFAPANLERILSLTPA